MALAQTFDDLAAFARDGHFGAARAPRVDALVVPPSARVGEDVQVSWRVERARHVELRLGGTEQARRAVAAEGRWTFRPRQPGRVLVELRCWGEGEAADGPAATVRQVRIEVTAPRARLELSHHVLHATPGTAVRLAWTATDAVAVQLLRPHTGERLPLPAQGHVTLVLDWVEETVRIRATGHAPADIAEQSCQLRPLLEGLADIDAELGTLDQPLQELATWTR